MKSQTVLVAFAAAAVLGLLPPPSVHSCDVTDRSQQTTGWSARATFILSNTDFVKDVPPKPALARPPDTYQDVPPSSSERFERDKQDHQGLRVVTDADMARVRKELLSARGARFDEILKD